MLWDVERSDHVYLEPYPVFIDAVEDVCDASHLVIFNIPDDVIEFDLAQPLEFLVK